RLASLYGEVMRSTSWTPSSISIRPGSGCPWPTAPSTVRVTPVDRCTSIPISTRRFTTCSICASLARSSMTTTIAVSLQSVAARAGDWGLVIGQSLIPNPLSLAMNQAPFEAPRFVDDPFEQPRDRVRSERPFRRDAAHVREHLLLALRLIHLDPQLLLQLADLARDARALVQQPDQHFVHAIDVVAQIVKRGHSSSTIARSLRRAESAPW